MRRLLFLAIAGAAAGLTLVDAQGPAATESRDLPIRRVVLYKSGIGFFEHVGRVTGNQRITVPFTSAQLDDVLKTLTVLDLDGGAVSTVGYNTDAPLDRRLEALGLPIAGDASFKDLLQSLRGARVEVTRGATQVSGRLLAVESKLQTRDNASQEVDFLSVASDAGTVHTLELGSGTSVRFADPGLSRRVDRYLAEVASTFDSDRRALTIATTGSGSRRLYVSYISEVPVWKATYRIVLPSDASARPTLQGWAIVDNTAGADWSDVELSLVAGAPQSFRQPVSQPMYLRRPEVPLSQTLLTTPQTYGGAIDSFGGAGGLVVDMAGAPLPGASVRVFDQYGRQLGATVTGVNGRFAVPGGRGHMRAVFELAGFESQQVEFEAGTDVRVSLAVGQMSETVSVAAEGKVKASAAMRRGGGIGGGAGGGVVAPMSPSPAYLANAVVPMEQAVARDLGDLFEYKLKNLVTIPKNQSAMVPILSSPIRVERVSTWRMTDGLPRPHRALWLTNSTDLTLDGGSVTVLDHESFAGEGLIETIKAGERRLLSYAIDLGMLVEAQPVGLPGQAQRIRIARGLMTIDTTECDQTRYTARNEDTTARQLVVEHPRREGWKLVEGKPSPEETSISSWRFLLPVAPKTSATLTVVSYRPVQSTMSLSALNDGQIALYLKNGGLDDAGRRALSEVLDQKKKIGDLTASVTKKIAEADGIRADQERIRGNMTSLKGSNEEKQLVQRYVKQLNDQEDRLKTLADERAQLEKQRADAQRALDEQIQTLTIGPETTMFNSCTL